MLRKEWPVVLTTEPSPQPLSFELCSVSTETTVDLCWDSVSYLAIEMSVQQIWGGGDHLPLFLQALSVPCSLFLLDYADVVPMVLFIFISHHFFLPLFKFSGHFLCLLTSAVERCSKVVFQLLCSPVVPLSPSFPLAVTDHIFLSAHVSHSFSC